MKRPYAQWNLDETNGEWRLCAGGCKIVATVWDNGTWHTWNADGSGGENSRCDTICEAKRQAAGSAVAQGFI